MPSRPFHSKFSNIPHLAMLATYFEDLSPSVLVTLLPLAVERRR